MVLYPFSMMTLSKAVRIHASSDRIWHVMTDIERWPEWTPSVTSIKRLTDGPLAVGSRVRIKQPKLLPAVWTVTQFHSGQSFDWTSSMPGVQVIGGHALQPAEDGCDVILSVRFEGTLSRFAEAAFGKLTEKYVQMEANGLKLRCEKGDS